MYRTRRRAALIRRAVMAGLFVLASGVPARAASCSISTTPISFGTYNALGTVPVDSMGTVTYECNGGGKPMIVTLTRGQGDTYTERAMIRGSDRLFYNLFLDAARTAVWGDGTGGTQPYYDYNPPNHADTTVAIFGRIPAAQDVGAGAYTDTVSVIINF